MLNSEFLADIQFESLQGPFHLVINAWLTQLCDFANSLPAIDNQVGEEDNALLDEAKAFGMQLLKNNEIIR
jgi:hypothetical protein